MKVKFYFGGSNQHKYNNCAHIQKHKNKSGKRRLKIIYKQKKYKKTTYRNTKVVEMNANSKETIKNPIINNGKVGMTRSNW